MGDGIFDLPPGFEFRPTDEDLVLHFLNHKASDSPSFPKIIPDLEFHLHNPWELNGKAMSDGNQWYFFSRRKEKGETRNGFWKQQDNEEAISTGHGKQIGIKKHFVFYVGEATQTNWVMIQYSLCTKLDYEEWVLCRVFEKKGGLDINLCDDDDNGSDLSYLDEMFLSFDDEICSQ